MTFSPSVPHPKGYDGLGFVPRLESLRGIAAVSVLIYHTTAMFVDTAVTGLVPVVLFFVLSGFVLARSLSSNSDPSVFFKNRIMRLVPVSAAMVLSLTFLYYNFGFHIGPPVAFSPLNIVLNALMIKSDINSVMWSLTVESLAAPLILASFFIFRRWGGAPFLPIIAVLFGLSFVGEYVHLLGGYTILSPLYAFVVGVLCHFRGREIVEKLGDLSWAAMIAASVLLIWCGLKKQTAPIIMLDCIGASLLIMLVAFKPSLQMSKSLDLGIVRFFGKISYSFYVVHPIGIAIVVRQINPERTSILSAAFITVLSIAVTTPMAWLSWRFVEIPFIRFRKRQGGRSAGRQSRPACSDPLP